MRIRPGELQHLQIQCQHGQQLFRCLLGQRHLLRNDGGVHPLNPVVKLFQLAFFHGIGAVLQYRAAERGNDIEIPPRQHQIMEPPLPQTQGQPPEIGFHIFLQHLIKPGSMILQAVKDFTQLEEADSDVAALHNAAVLPGRHTEAACAHVSQKRLLVQLGHFDEGGVYQSAFLPIFQDLHHKVVLDLQLIQDISAIFRFTQGRGGEDTIFRDPIFLHHLGVAPQNGRQSAHRLPAYPAGGEYLMTQPQRMTKHIQPLHARLPYLIDAHADKIGTDVQYRDDFHHSFHGLLHFLPPAFRPCLHDIRYLHLLYRVWPQCSRHTYQSLENYPFRQDEPLRFKKEQFIIQSIYSLRVKKY